MEKLNLEMNKAAVSRVIAEIEKLDGFLISSFKNPEDRRSEFPLLYEFKDRLKLESDKIDLKA